MIMKNQISHNNKGYGKRIAYIAKLTGYDEKYRFKREFIEKNIEYKNASRTTWYDYSWVIDESGIYEYKESNAYKKEKFYFKYDKETDDYKILNIIDVKKIFSKP